jgi:hypothetical protein
VVTDISPNNVGVSDRISYIHQISDSY